MKALKFASGVLGAELPVDGDACCVALGVVGGDSGFQSVGVGVFSLENGTARYAEFDLSCVKPSGVFGRVELLCTSLTNRIRDLVYTRRALWPPLTGLHWWLLQ